jgi:uncharacterized phage protein (TIGR01671 family)
VYGYYERAFDESENREISLIKYQVFEFAGMSYPYPSVHCHCVEVLDETVGQFTGLFDKNGTEIYEDDIVRFETDYYDKSGDLQHRIKHFKVIHHIETDVMKTGGTMISEFCLEDIEKGYYPYSSILHQNKIEVIGNVTDNPELLTKKAEKQ